MKDIAKCHKGSANNYTWNILHYFNKESILQKIWYIYLQLLFESKKSILLSFFLIVKYSDLK